MTFYLNLTIWFSGLKTWIDVSWVGTYLFFSDRLKLQVKKQIKIT